MAKKPKKSITETISAFKTIGQSFKAKGKLTTGQHFIDAAELIESQQKRIKELEDK